MWLMDDASMMSVIKGWSNILIPGRVTILFLLVYLLLLLEGMVY